MRNGRHRSVSVSNRLTASALDTHPRSTFDPQNGQKNNKKNWGRILISWEQCRCLRPPLCCTPVTRAVVALINMYTLGQKSHARIRKPLPSDCVVASQKFSYLVVVNGVMLMIINICCNNLMSSVQTTFLRSPDVASNKRCAPDAT